jgi:outer membrane immunogenic protein
MKKYLLALAAVATCAGSALAADLPARTYTKAPAAVAPVATWTGCWLGGGVGYGLWDQQNTDFNTFGTATVGSVPVPVGAQLTDTSNAGGKGWLGRIGAGCDYQFGVGAQQFVIGGFGDYDWSDLHGRLVDPSTGVGGNEKMDNQWAVGGRIGWVALPGLMTFVSGGYTQAHFKGVTFTDSFFPNIGAPTGLSRDAATYHGWFIGGGDEYAFSWLPGLFWKTEYRVSEFDRQTIVDRALGVPLFTTDSKKWVQTVTSSVVWRFNFSGVPSAWH